MGSEGIQSMDDIVFLRRRITILCESGDFSKDRPEHMKLVDDWIAKNRQLLEEKPVRTLRDIIISEIDLAGVYAEIGEDDLARSTIRDLVEGPLTGSGFEDLEDEIYEILDSLT